MTATLTLHRELAAPPATVFDAWITQSTMRQWLFAGDTGEIVDVTADPRPGGRYSILERRADGEVDHYGTYTTVRRPHRLEFDVHVPRHFAERTTITVDIEPQAAGAA